MPEFWFIRHGESVSNAGLPTGNTIVTPITERGRAEADITARAIPATPSLIVTSPYLRTKQTAEPTLRRFPHVPHEEWPVHEFTYLSLPQDVETTFHERRPLTDAYWQRCDPLHCDGEGTESFNGLMLRVAAARERMVELQEEFVLIFSHGLFMKALLWSLIFSVGDIDATAMARYRSFMQAVSVPNGAILKIRTDEKKELWFSGIMTNHLEKE